MARVSSSESSLHTLAITLSFPLAIPGALQALVLADMSLGMSSQIVVISLTGPVAKNANSFVDHAHRQ